MKMALELQEYASSDNVIITAYTRLGVLYMEQEKWNQALKALNHAITIGKKANYPFPLSYATLMMGDLFLCQDKKSESIRYYKETLKLAREYNYKNANTRPCWLFPAVGWIVLKPSSQKVFINWMQELRLLVLE